MSFIGIPFRCLFFTQELLSGSVSTLFFFFPEYSFIIATYSCFMDSISPLSHLKILMIVYLKRYSLCIIFLYVAFVYMCMHEHVLVIMNFILKSPLSQI